MADPKVVSASPVKSFFVRMLTRDIELSDAILDLLDNCIDGILRENAREGSNKQYSGYRIDIAMSPKSFVISDNCGGISLDVLKNYAFRMGRDPDMPKDSVATVGTFGIGMKRAIFKMGKQCDVLTKSRADFCKGEKHTYKVSITPKWIENESQWEIPYEVLPATASKEFGTRIEISSLHDGTAKIFNCGESRFDDVIRKQIAVTYGFMIAKGLEISVNKQVVSAVPMELKCGHDMSPYCYKARLGDVDVFLAIGITSPLVGGDGTPEEGGPSKYSSQNAGWTVLCNDRVVLYADKTILTGWGEAGVPQFHPQYNAISGIVSFSSSDVRQLPTTTTKRGVDAANPVYLAVKNFMREGTKACVKFTNDWKKREAEVRGKISSVASVSFQAMRDKPSAKKLGIGFMKTNKGQGAVARPKLPVPPKKASSSVSCAITVSEAKVRSVASYLGVPFTSPGAVVKESFEHVYREAVAR